MEIITVQKSGLITGVTRYTRIPDAALELSDFNAICPNQAVKKEFECEVDTKES
jgi:hypothetical protein